MIERINFYYCGIHYCEKNVCLRTNGKTSGQSLDTFFVMNNGSRELYEYWHVLSHNDNQWGLYYIPVLFRKSGFIGIFRGVAGK